MRQYGFMPAVGNYVARDYNSRNHRSTWSDYNKAWGQRRSKSIAQGQQLRNSLSSAINTITITATQQQTVNTIRAGAQASPYASPQAVSARVNLLI